MDRVGRLMGGFVLGAALGAFLGLLLAPQSGAETRRKALARLEEVLAEGREAAQATRSELLAQFEELKRPAA